MPTTSERGYTLLEVLVAVFIAGVVAAFAAPSLSAGLRAHSLTSATRITVNQLRMVRASAIARRTQARLAVASANQLAIEVNESGVWRRVGSGVVLGGAVRVTAVSPNGGIVFDPEGTTTVAGTVRLRNTLGDERAVSISLLGVIGTS